MDCETRRFTIEQSGSPGAFKIWCLEIEHAINAGRQIVSVPIDSETAKEIEALAAGLGYALWPSRTILSPPQIAAKAETNVGRVGQSGAWLIDEERKLRPSAPVGVN
jgi:hypothetical protein